MNCQSSTKIYQSSYKIPNMYNWDQLYEHFLQSQSQNVESYKLENVQYIYDELELIRYCISSGDSSPTRTHSNFLVVLLKNLYNSHVCSLIKQSQLFLFESYAAFFYSSLPSVLYRICLDHHYFLNNFILLYPRLLRFW